MKSHKYMLPDELSNNKSLRKLFNKHNRSSQATLALASLGLLLLLVGTFTLPFNKGLFSQLFNRPNSSAMTMSSPMPMFTDLPNCGLTNPAFCDTFSTPFPGGRAGDLDDSKWSLGRTTEDNNPGQGRYNAFHVTDEMFCRTPISNIVPGQQDSFFCDANGQESMHWMTAINDTNYALEEARIRQPFDFTNRTGEIAFAVDAVNRGTHSWWPELVISDQPIQSPHEEKPGNENRPRYGLDFEFSAGNAISDSNLFGITDDTCTSIGDAIEFNDYNMVKLTNTAPADCIQVTRDMANHFLVKLSQTHIEIWGSDKQSTDINHLLFSADINLPFSVGYVTLGQAEYNPPKFNGESYHTYHWHDVGFDGPVLPTPRSYEIPDNNQIVPAPGPNTDINPGFANLGYLVPKTSPGKTLTFKNVDLFNATSATLTLNARSLEGNPLMYSLNGNAWHTLQVPYVSTASSLTPPLSMDSWQSLIDQNVPLSELKSGDNTLSIYVPNTDVVVANIDLELNGTNITPVSEQTVMPPKQAFMSVTPTGLDPKEFFHFGQTGQITISMHDPDMVAMIGGASATVKVDPNFQIQSITPGDCQMNFSKMPTPQDPSFTGTIPDTNISACTIEVLNVMPVKLSNETEAYANVILSNASIQDTSGNQILGAAYNDYLGINTGSDTFYVQSTPNQQVTKPGGYQRIDSFIENVSSANITNPVSIITITDPTGQVVFSQSAQSSTINSFTNGGFNLVVPTSSFTNFGVYTVSQTTTSSDGSITYFKNPDVTVFQITADGNPLSSGSGLPSPTPSPSPTTSPTPSSTPPSSVSFNSTVSVSPLPVIPGQTETMTSSLTNLSSQTVAGEVELSIINPQASQVFSQIIPASGTQQFVSNTPRNNSVSFTLPTNSLVGTYMIDQRVLASDGVTTLYDNPSAASFTVTSSSPSPSATPYLAGDFNNTGHVDISDLSIFAASYLTVAPNIPNPQCDLNNDGKVNLADLSLFSANYGK